MIWLAEKKTTTSPASDDWKTLKTLDGVTIEIRQLEHTAERLEWAVRSRPGHLLLRVSVTVRALHGTPAEARPHGRDWTPDEIERGIVYAVENALVSPHPSTTQVIREVALTCYDLYAANGLI